MPCFLQNYLNGAGKRNLYDTLSAHDRKYHPRGFHDGASCKFRDQLNKTDKSDTLGGSRLSEAVGIFKNWAGGRIRVLDEKEAEKEYSKLGDSVRAFITQDEFRAWNRILGYYTTHTSKLGGAYPAEYRHVVLNRVPSVVAKCFERAGFNPKPERVDVSFTVLDKITGTDRYSTKVADNRIRNEYVLKKQLRPDENIEAILNKSTHAIAMSDVRKIQLAIDDPIAVFRSPDPYGIGKFNETLTVLTDVVDKSTGNRAILPLRYRIDKKTNTPKLEISSMYGRGNGDLLAYIGKSDELLYVNKQKARGFLQSSTHLWGSQVGNASGVANTTKPPLTENDFTNDRLGEIVANEDVASQSASTRAFVDSTSHIAGWYNRKNGDTTLVRGRADAKTVSHEIGWHATFAWAEKNMPELHKKLIQYAKEAPASVVETVIERYGEKLSPEVLLDEIGAERFTRDHMKRISDEIERRKADGWWDDVESGQNRASAAFVASEGSNVLTNEELARVASLPPSDAVRELIEAMLSGRTLDQRVKRPKKFDRVDLKQFLVKEKS